ncbi:MAG: hypothetical protein AB7F59_08740 [Bdellovibrionales bacterium]
MKKQNVAKKATVASARAPKAKKLAAKSEPVPATRKVAVKSKTKHDSRFKSLKGFVRTNFRTSHNTLRETLAMYGIGVEDIKSRAKQLEKVIQDIRSQDFLKKPSIQSLMQKVQQKQAPETAVVPQTPAPAIEKPKVLSSEEAKDEFFRSQVLTEDNKKELGNHLVKAILHRVDEFRKSLTPSAETISSMNPLASRKKKKKS